MSTDNHTIQLPFTTSHAFLIGIDDYEEVSPLSTAVNDAKTLAEALGEHHGYQVHPPLLNATKADITQLLEEELPRLVKEEDRVFFYFAGHGIALDSDDDPKGYLVPADARPGDTDTLVAMDSFHRAITSLPCQHGLLVLDCCFAGAFKWSTGFRDVVFDLPGIIYEERFYQYTRDPAWQVITSSASDQKAVDVLSDRTLGMRNQEGDANSPFANALLDGIAGEADTIPKASGDGVITATELYTYLRDRVEDETSEQGKRQSPSMFSLQKHNKGQYIFLHPNHRFNLPPIPRRNPFMGLKSYSESDAPLFYGRDRVIEALDKLVQEQQLVVVSGASGTGKSSVIKAGLLGRLRAKEWEMLPIIRPGKEPLGTLALEIPDLSTCIKKGVPSVLVIDQYEELITQCLDPADRVVFEKKLADWLETYPHLHIVISIRSDFEPHFEKGALQRWWQQGRYQVPIFNQDEIREIIIKPTIQEVLFFEPETLVDNLVDAVNQAPGALPLLSFTLSELYHTYINSGRINRSFTLEDYQKLGGVVGALRTRANAIYDAMDEDHQASMRKLMLRMISLEGGETASRRVLAEELIFTEKEETQRVQMVAQQLIDARLITSGQDKEGQTYYEPAHDALVRAWPSLWEWIRRVGERNLGLLHKLHLAVVDYQEKKEKDYLWHDDPRLHLLAPVLAADRTVFNAGETDFIERSQHLKVRNLRRRRIITIGIIVTLLSTSLISFIFYHEAEKSLEQANHSLIQAQIMQEKEENATFAANLALQQLDTISQDLVRSKSDITEIVFKSIDALQLYKEKLANPGGFNKNDKIRLLIREISEYGDRLRVLLPVEYEGAGWGYNDALGNIAIYPRYEEASEFGENEEATVKLEGYTYQIDKQGNILGATDPLWQWVPFSKDIGMPANSVIGGFEMMNEDTIPLYIGQNTYHADPQNGRHSGKVKEGRLYIPWEGKTIPRDTFNILTLSDQYQGIWIDPTLLATYESFGWRSVLTGFRSATEGDHRLLSRTVYKDQLIPGMLFDKTSHFTYGNTERNYAEYQVYVVAKANLAPPPQDVLKKATQAAKRTAETHRGIIHNFIKAEDQRELATILPFYAQDVERYWKSENPGVNEIGKSYQLAWEKTTSSANQITSIEAVDNTTYLLRTRFQFLRKEENAVTTVSSKIMIVFDDQDKILEIVNADAITSNPAKRIAYGYVNSDNVRVRETPVTGEEVTQLNSGARVEIIRSNLPPGESIEWVLIKHQDDQGWMRSDFIKQYN